MKMLARAGHRLSALCAILAVSFLAAPAEAQPLVTPNPNRTGLPGASTFDGTEYMDFRQNGLKVTAPVATVVGQTFLATPSLTTQIRGPGALDFRLFCPVGDSRDFANQNGATWYNGTGSPGVLAHLSAIHGRAIAVRCAAAVTTLGISGNRFDQTVLANGAAAIASPAGNIWIGGGCVNDIGQSGAGYTTVTNAAPYAPWSNTAVTSANVARVCADQKIALANALLAAGHKVFMESEAGSSGFSASLVGAVFEVNQRVSDFAEGATGVTYVNTTAALWNPTSSTTAIAFKSGLSPDGVHRTTAGAYAEAAEVDRQIGSMIPTADFNSCNTADNPSTNPRQLFNNAIFATTSGGTTSGAGTLSSGAVPSGWDLNIPAGLSVTITYAAGPCGNVITLAVTANNAGTVKLRQTPAAASWSIGDFIQTGMKVSVAAGSSAMNIWTQTDVSTNDAGGANGTASSYGLYGTTAGPTIAYAYANLATRPIASRSDAATKAYANGALNINFSAAGSGTVSAERASMARSYATN